MEKKKEKKGKENLSLTGPSCARHVTTKNSTQLACTSCYLALPHLNILSPLLDSQKPQNPQTLETLLHHHHFSISILISRFLSSILSVPLQASQDTTPSSSTCNSRFRHQRSLTSFAHASGRWTVKIEGAPV